MRVRILTLPERVAGNPRLRKYAFERSFLAGRSASAFLAAAKRTRKVGISKYYKGLWQPRSESAQEVPLSGSWAPWPGIAQF